MKVYLHLADTGYTLSDLSLRIYSGTSLVSASGVTLVPFGSFGVDYYLDNIPTPGDDGLTLTFESPLGVYHAYRFGIADTQPLNVIIPIREVFADPVDDLSIRLFKDDVEVVPDLSDVVQLNLDGEYSVSGWTSTPINQQWSVRWIYNGQTFVHSWVGTTRPSVLLPVSVFYQEIRATQSPFPYRVDGLNRVMFSCNYIARAVSPVNKFEDAIEEMLRSTNHIGSDEMLFIGPLAVWPDDESIYFVLVSTGGFEPDETHDTKRENLGLQIITTSPDYEIARDRSFEIYHYLDGLRSVSVTL